MTFTSSQMSQARYTTRGTTLDLVQDVSDDAGKASTALLDAPADGLSFTEAQWILRDVQRIRKAAETLAQTVSILRARE